MQIKDVEVRYKAINSKYKLYCISDIHAGTIHCVEDRIKAKVAQIEKERNSFWIGLGDYGEFILPSDFKPLTCF